MSSRPLKTVAEPSQLRGLVRDLANQPAFALDLESNGFHRYPERVCLLQFATPRAVYLVDPLSLEDLSPLGPVLADQSIEKVLHGADYDLRSLDRDWAFEIGNLFDTGIAAKFVGIDKAGLATVTEEVLGTTLAKDKRLQRADWSIRPLSEEALEYAADDVRHLVDLRGALGRRLKQLGRTDWVAEECRRLAGVRYVAPNLETAFLSVKGTGGLDPRALAVFRALHRFREAQARLATRPPFRLFPDKALVELALEPSTKLDEVPGLGPNALRRWGRGLRQAVQEGLDSPPVQRPRAPRERVSPEESSKRAERLKGLKGWRSDLGKRLGLDPPLLWPTVSMERLSRGRDSLDDELNAAEVREWQRREAAPSLQAWMAGDLGRGLFREATSEEGRPSRRRGRSREGAA